MSPCRIIKCWCQTILWAPYFWITLYRMRMSIVVRGKFLGVHDWHLQPCYRKFETAGEISRWAGNLLAILSERACKIFSPKRLPCGFASSRPLVLLWLSCFPCHHPIPVLSGGDVFNCCHVFSGGNAFDLGTGLNLHGKVSNWCDPSFFTFPTPIFSG